ncbi:MAG: flagellar motor protein MotB [Bdellovibrionales bacterium]
MSRRRRHKAEEEHESSERWLVSYADFITLMFAFFVVLYATSSRNEGKEQEFEKSVRQHLAKIGGGGVMMLRQGAGGDKETPNEYQRLDSPIENPLNNYKLQDPGVGDSLKRIELFIEENFSKEEISKFIQDIFASDKGVRVVLYGDVVFDGSYLHKDSLAILDKLAVALKEEQKKIIVEAHSSKKEVLPKGENFWSLGSKRATTVARYLSERNDLSPQSLVPIGHGTNRPRYPDGQEGDRLKNSRLVFFLIPMDTEI